VQLDKQQIISFLKDRGDDQKARRADDELPQKVDTDKPEHQNLLQRIGIDPMELAKQFLGGRGIPGL
jgi:hypothetical protein